MFSGNEGNTFYVESGLDTHLKWRLSLQGGLMYVFPRSSPVRIWVASVSGCAPR